MKISLKLSLVLSVLICTQAASNTFFQYNCNGNGRRCPDNAYCKGVSFFTPLPVCSTGGSRSVLSTKVDVYTSSDCVDSYDHSYGCYSNPSSRILHGAMTESLDPNLPIHPCPTGSKCPGPSICANYIMIEGKVHGGQAIKLRSTDIPQSIGYSDKSFRSYYIFLTNPASKRLRYRHPNDIKLDYFKEHYDILEIRDVDDNLVEMRFNPKNNV